MVNVQNAHRAMALRCAMVLGCLMVLAVGCGGGKDEEPDGAGGLPEITSLEPTWVMGLPGETHTLTATFEWPEDTTPTEFAADWFKTDVIPNRLVELDVTTVIEADGRSGTITGTLTVPDGGTWVLSPRVRLAHTCEGDQRDCVQEISTLTSHLVVGVATVREVFPLVTEATMRVGEVRPFDAIPVEVLSLDLSGYRVVSSSALLTWSSSNESVATVDEHGFVTAHALGTTTLVASAGGVHGETALVVE